MQRFSVGKFHNDDPSPGRQLSFGYFGIRAAHQVSSAMQGDGLRGQLAVTPELFFVESLNF